MCVEFDAITVVAFRCVKLENTWSVRISVPRSFRMSKFGLKKPPAVFVVSTPSVSLRYITTLNVPPVTCASET